MNIIPKEAVLGFAFDKDMYIRDSNKEWDVFVTAYPHGIDSFKVLLVDRDPDLLEYFHAYNLCKMFYRLQEADDPANKYIPTKVKNLFSKHMKQWRLLGELLATKGLPAAGYLKAQIKYLPKDKCRPTALLSANALERWERYKRTELAKVVLSKDKEEALRKLATEEDADRSYRYYAGERYFLWLKGMVKGNMTDEELIWNEVLAISPDYLITRTEFTSNYVPGIHPLLDRRVNEAMIRARATK